MKEIIKIITVLTTVCVICAFLLAFVFNAAKEKININAEKTVKDSISRLAPFAQKVEKTNLKNEIIYKLYKKGNNFFGYAFIAEGQGYQGKIKMLAVVDSSWENLEGIEVIESVETPGLGAKIQEGDFKKQFQKLKTIPAIEYVKETVIKNNQIKAITGATISSKAVVNILNNRIVELRKQKTDD